MVYYLLPISAGVVELVDTGDLKSPGSDTVPVRVRSPAPSGPSEYRGVEQLVARRAHNPKVVGSNPAPATKQDGFSKPSFLFPIFSKMPENGLSMRFINGNKIELGKVESE